jgi:hypothetical protein
MPSVMLRRPDLADKILSIAVGHLESRVDSISPTLRQIQGFWGPASLVFREISWDDPFVSDRKSPRPPWVSASHS